MKGFFLRFTRLIAGLFLYGLGVVLAVQANVGLAPWDAFASGVSIITGISLGVAVILTGAVILIIVLLMREKIGIGTVLNTLLIGTFYDMIQSFSIIPKCENFFAGVGLLLVGQFVMCLATYLYIGSGFGCGPRDSLMVAIMRRLPKVPIGVARGAIEGSVLVIGYLMGAKVGVGTLISVFGISFMLQATFHVLRFDVKAVEHESILDTWKRAYNAWKHKETA